MDKETIELVEGVRKLLTAYEETAQGSVLKKTRKVTSQIIWSADEYLDDLDNPDKIVEQVKNTQLILNEFKTNNSPSQLAAESLNKFI